MLRGRAVVVALALGSLWACGGEDGSTGRDEDATGLEDTADHPADSWQPTDVIQIDVGETPTMPDEDRVHAAGGQSATVLVYMVGDNNLEEAALVDLWEMAQVGSGPGFTLAVQIDRSPQFTSDAALNLADFASTKRLRVDEGSLLEVADLGEVNMGDPASLVDFLTWGAATYPADRYALIFWDHGGAWPGFGGDETDQHDLLDLHELRAGLQQGMTSAGIEQFALLGFDACLMATVEVALALSPFGEYLLASEEIEPGHGWDWRRFQELRDNPALPIPTLGDALLQGYEAQATAEGQQTNITLSLVDLYAVVPVYNALSTLAGVLSANLGALSPGIALEKQRAPEFGKMEGKSAFHMFDLGTFAAGLGQQHAALRPVTDALVAALGASVVDLHNGPLHAEARGLSIYFPPRAAYAAGYDALDEMAPWRSFLEGWYSAGDAIPDGLRPEFTNPNDVATASLTAGGLALSGSLVAGTGPYVTSATLAFGLLDGQQVILLGEQGAFVSGDAVSGAWDQAALVMKQGSAQAWAYLALEPDGDYLVASIPLAYYEVGAAEGALAMLVYILDAQSGAVLQASYYLVTEGGAGELFPSPGAGIAPVVPVVDASGDVAWQVTAESAFDPAQAIDFAREPLPDGTSAYATLTVSDFGDHQDSVYTTFTVGIGAAATCEQCYAEQCASEDAACSATPACLELWACAGACADQACLDTCAATYPGGIAGYNAVVLCVQDHCADVCL